MLFLPPPFSPLLCFKHNNLFEHHKLSVKDIQAIIISSVVPPLVVPISKMCKRYFNIEPLIVGPGIKTGIRLKYETQEKLEQIVLLMQLEPMKNSEDL